MFEVHHLYSNKMRRDIIKFLGGPNDGHTIVACDLMGEYIWTSGSTENVVICHATYARHLPCYKREGQAYRFVGYATRGKIEDDKCEGK